MAANIAAANTKRRRKNPGCLTMFGIGPALEALPFLLSLVPSNHAMSEERDSLQSAMREMKRELDVFGLRFVPRNLIGDHACRG
jgi:hypothetical protein